MSRLDKAIKAAWQHYIPLGSKEYERANQERVKNGKVEVSKYGSNEHSVTLVASINVDPATGRAISGHEYDPKAQSMKDIEACYDEYLAQTPPERRLVIFEGDKRLLPSKEEAIRTSTESGLVQYLANEREVPAVSGEPSDLEIAEALEEEGVDRKDLAALYVVRSIAGYIRQQPDNYANLELGPIIYFKAGRVGLEGFHVYSEEEKNQIKASNRMDEVAAQMSKEAEGLVSTINDKVRKELGRDLLLVKDGRIQLNSGNRNVEAIDSEIAPLWNPVLDGELNEIARRTSTVRDRHLFEKIITYYEQGKSPFVPYGGSHITCLKPAIEAYFSVKNRQKST